MNISKFSFAYLLIACAAPGVALAQEQLPVVHDPVMAEENGTYYVFNTGRGIQVLASPDMKEWTRLKPVFENTPAWVMEVIPEFDGNIWAPDIFYRDGVYYLYYSVSQFGRNNSAIGLATNTTLDPNDPAFRWVDQGEVVQSVPGRDMWNAIDPTVAVDEEGRAWMFFGSHWGGIKAFVLNEGLDAPAEPEHWRTVAARHRYWKIDERDAGDAANPNLGYDSLYSANVLRANQLSMNSSIEAPFVFKKGDYYYLFVSWDRCCRGVNSTYKVVVGRAKDIEGPYYDREGEKMEHGGGSLVVQGFGGDSRWAAGGHNGAYTFDGQDYLVFHAYDRESDGAPRLIVRPIDWDAYGWPTVSLETRP